MADERYDYPRLVEDALRTVVRDVLRKAAREGVVDPHHFFITFRTDHPDVDVHDDLRARYPSEMSIVLQHQFWGLDAGEDGFEVQLSFSGIARRLYVPYGALTGFADPGADFGLRFTPVTSDCTDEATDRPVEAAAEPDASADESRDADGSADVVALDRFRKR